MTNYIYKYFFILLIFIYACSDNPINSNGGSSTETGDIFYVKSTQQSLAGATYSIKADGTNKKLVNDSLGITSIPYSNKMTLARADIGFYYNKLYVANINGTNITQIPRNSYYPAYYILSPTGNKVLFTTDAGNYMCVVNADGTNLIQISDGIRGTETVPKFSPDGNYIAYFEAPANLLTALYIIKTDGSGKTMLKDSITYDIGGTLDWSPDGNKIVFENREPFPTGICVINKDGSGFRRITEGMTPSWSPDGSKICFLKNVNQGIFDLYIINPDGSNEMNLSNSPSEYDGLPSWSPDSKKILYHAQISNPGKLKIYDINSMSSKVLVDSTLALGFWKR